MQCSGSEPTADDSSNSTRCAVLRRCWWLRTTCASPSRATCCRGTGRPFFSGSQAVDLFFVLSGYVLSLPHWREKVVPYPTYLVRRVVRIYLPFAAAAALSILGAWIFRGYHLTLTHFFNGVWQSHITLRDAVLQFEMWPMSLFNVSFWSLRYEMQLSILMPAILWLLRRQPAPLVLAGSLVAAFASMGLIQQLDRFHLAGQTLQIGSLFVLGAVLARHQARLCSAVRRLGSAGWLLLATSLFLYFNYPARLPLGRLQPLLADRGMLTSALGAAGLLVCALSLPSFSRALQANATEYLGRISYSLYLVHSIALIATLDLLYGHLPLPVIFLIVALGCWGMAHLFCLWIEEPCARLSRRVPHRGRLLETQTGVPDIPRPALEPGRE